MVGFTGVMLAVDSVVEMLKSMSKQVTTPEEIAQVSTLSSLIYGYNLWVLSTSVTLMIKTYLIPRSQGFR